MRFHGILQGSKAFNSFHKMSSTYLVGFYSISVLMCSVSALVRVAQDLFTGLAFRVQDFCWAGVRALFVEGS